MHKTGSASQSHWTTLPRWHGPWVPHIIVFCYACLELDCVFANSQLEQMKHTVAKRYLMSLIIDATED